MKSIAPALGLCLFLLLAFTCWCSETKSTGKEAPESSISPWQYCFGCKETVVLYTKRTNDALIKMQKAGKPSSTMLEANSLVEGMCDSPDLSRYQPFVRWSCVKLMNEYQTKFLEKFAGEASVTNINNLSSLFKRKRQICVKETKACPAADFKKANLTMSARTKCAACNIVASEIQVLSKALAKGAPLRQILEDDFCSALGGSFQPYGWVQDVCQEIVEDYAADIVDTIAFHAQVAATGLTPSETLPQMVCRERMRCKAIDEL